MKWHTPNMYRSHQKKLRQISNVKAELQNVKYFTQINSFKTKFTQKKIDKFIKKITIVYGFLDSAYTHINIHCSPEKVKKILGSWDNTSAMGMNGVTVNGLK